MGYRNGTQLRLDMLGPGISEIHVAIDSHRGQAFLDEVDTCCLRIMRPWLEKGERKNGVPANVTARIMDTVRTLILKPVYSEMSMRQIAQLARVTEGTMYRLFGSRSRLSACVRRQTLKKIFAVTRRFVAERGMSAFTMQDIADEVGLSEEELRFLFSSVDLLLDHTLRQSP